MSASAARLLQAVHTLDSAFGVAPPAEPEVITRLLGLVARHRLDDAVLEFVAQDALLAGRRVTVADLLERAQLLTRWAAFSGAARTPDHPTTRDSEAEALRWMLRRSESPPSPAGS